MISLKLGVGDDDVGYGDGVAEWRRTEIDEARLEAKEAESQGAENLGSDC